MQIIKIFNSFIPKNYKILLFCTYPDFSDNAEALYRYYCRNQHDYDLRWIVKDENTKMWLEEKGIAVAQKRSLKALLWILRAGVLITSDLAFASVRAETQFYVNLWHGMPLKAMGYMDQTKPLDKNANLKDRKCITISTSETMRTLMCASFGQSVRRVYVTGQPRCDDLFSLSKNEELEKVLGKNIRGYTKVVFYMPTFREGYLGREEGSSLAGNNLFRFSNFNKKEFVSFLKRNKILFVGKLHPLEEEEFYHTFKQNSDFMVLLNSQAFSKYGIPFYGVLARADLLVTDYSSVYFDFLLFDKPLIFTPTDLDEYRRRRGFVIEPYDFWTPGPKVTTQEGLQKQIIECLNNPSYYELERKTIRNIIHTYRDNQSCKRVAETILFNLGKENTLKG